MMKICKYPATDTWDQLLRRPVIDTAELDRRVSSILEEVKRTGDAALRNYALQFDQVQLDELRVPLVELDTVKVEPALESAMKLAAANIRAFHEAQREKEKIIETIPGVQCWRRAVGIERVGLYIPGGSAPLFSTVLMLGIPAALAGCREVILCTPAAKDGKVNPAILFAARLCGIRKVFRVGGAQAIGAMAYGTQSIPRVDKIFGPGNQYVTAAKLQVQREGVAIDMPAGPSEVAVLADDSAVPAFVAADLLSQAEHGPDSQVLLVTDSEKLIEAVAKKLEEQLRSLSRKTIAARALENSKAILVKDLNDGMELLNCYAPEHLIISCKDADKLAEKVRNAGSVFLGNYSPESAGDYASGTNHTLPTNGYAKAYSGVSLDSFVKKITFQQISKEGLNKLGEAIRIMALAEGLDAHSNTISIRKNV